MRALLLILVGACSDSPPTPTDLGTSECGSDFGPRCVLGQDQVCRDPDFRSDFWNDAPGALDNTLEVMSNADRPRDVFGFRCLHARTRTCGSAFVAFVQMEDDERVRAEVYEVASGEQVAGLRLTDSTYYGTGRQECSKALYGNLAAAECVSALYDEMRDEHFPHCSPYEDVICDTSRCTELVY